MLDPIDTFGIRFSAGFLLAMRTTALTRHTIVLTCHGVVLAIFMLWVLWEGVFQGCSSRRGRERRKHEER